MKALRWDKPTECVLTQTVPSAMFLGRGHSQYVRDNVLNNSEKPEYESIQVFVEFKRDLGEDFYDYQDLTALVVSESSTANDVRRALHAEKLTLRSYRPKGVGESLKQQRDRLQGESEMSNRVYEFAMITTAIASELPEASQEKLTAVLRRVNGHGYASYVENLSAEDRAAAMVDVATALIAAGKVSEAKNAILEAKAALDESKSPKNPAQVALEKANALARMANKAAKKAEILRVYMAAETAEKA